MWWSLSVTCDWSRFFLRVLRFPPRYTWNIVACGAKHHKPPTKSSKSMFFSTKIMIFPKTVDQIVWNLHPHLWPLYLKVLCQTDFKINHLLYSSFAYKPWLYSYKIIDFSTTKTRKFLPLRRLELIHLTSYSRPSYFQTSCKNDFEYNQFYLFSVIKTQTTW
jgi:hypothetical protein